MHKRTRACSISQKTKRIVYERDGRCCIFCGAPGLPEAHYIPRSQGGLGIPENIVTACRICHDLMDNSTKRQQMLQEAAAHLKGFYPEWNEKSLIYDKWRKDKGDKAVESEKVTKTVNFGADFAEKSQKDKGKEPPDGFYYL